MALERLLREDQFPVARHLKDPTTRGDQVHLGSGKLRTQLRCQTDSTRFVVSNDAVFDRDSHRDPGEGNRDVVPEHGGQTSGMHAEAMRLVSARPRANRSALPRARKVGRRSASHLAPSHASMVISLMPHPAPPSPSVAPREGGPRRPLRMAVVVLGVAGVLVSGPASAQNRSVAAPSPSTDTSAGDWPTALRDAAGTRFSNLTQITPGMSGRSRRLGASRVRSRQDGRGVPS